LPVREPEREVRPKAKAKPEPKAGGMFDRAA
jgi:hypothetical protein